MKWVDCVNWASWINCTNLTNYLIEIMERQTRFPQQLNKLQTYEVQYKVFCEVKTIDGHIRHTWAYWATWAKWMKRLNWDGLERVEPTELAELIELMEWTESMEDGFAKLTESIDIFNISELIGRLELNGLNELLNKLIELSGLLD